MTLRIRLLIVLALIAALLLAFWFAFARPDVARLSVEAVSGPQPRITEPRVQSIPTFNTAPVVGWTGDAKPVAAAGLSVAQFARDLDHPRWLYALPNGDILVAETNAPPRTGWSLQGAVAQFFMNRAGAGGASANRITLLRDTNGDGVADARSVLLSGLDSPFGMALIGDRLYVANRGAIVAYPYKTGDTRIAANPEKIIDLPSGGLHWTRNLIASPDGKLLYVAVGSATNIAEDGIDGEKGRAAIWEVTIATKTKRIFANGLRNPVGLAYNPQSKRLWATVNERDMLGSDGPPDYMTLVDEGGFYGWPYSYWGGYEDPRVDPNPEMIEYTKRPDYALGPHTASLGLAFGSVGGFRSGAFIGQHGSWNRVPRSGYKVVFVPFAPTGFPSGPMRDVLTGFLDTNGNAQGRPAGVIMDIHDDLLVADDVGNRIWRVTAR